MPTNIAAIYSSKNVICKDMRERHIEWIYTESMCWYLREGNQVLSADVSFPEYDCQAILWTYFSLQLYFKVNFIQYNNQRYYAMAYSILF